ncbi:MAG: hypothetical protein PHW31_03010 [Candidatus Pacebacteria bacterium]|nr:hypothetical protein [Candidatus Paceibacterota bacterium]
MVKRTVFLFLMVFLCFPSILLALDIQPISKKQVDEGQTLTVIIEVVSDYPPVHFAILNPLPGMDLQNVRQVSQDNFACDFVWTPSFDQAGDYQVIISAEDKAEVKTEDFIVKVRDVNRPPGEPLQSHPSDGETITYNDKLVFSWDGEKYDADGDEVEFLVEVWKNGPKENFLVSVHTKDIFYETTLLLQAGDYMWQVTAIDEHGEAKESSVWQFCVGQWFKINIDSTVFVTFIRKPGEYTFKWTNIEIQSNGNLGLCFNPIDAVGPSGEKIKVTYGIKEPNGTIVWHEDSWIMGINLPENGYTFELYAKIKIEPKHSSGLYQGELKLNIAMIQ